MRWSYTRHSQYSKCKSVANYWRENTPKRIRKDLHKLVATGVLVHRAFESLLKDHKGQPVKQTYRSIRPRDILLNLNHHLGNVNLIGDEELPSPKLVVMKSMIQNGLRHLVSKWPNAIIYDVELELKSEDVIGVVDLVLINERNTEVGVVLIDWKTRNARPISTNYLQLAVYEKLSESHIQCNKVYSYLALVHPRQNTMLPVTNSGEYLDYVEELIEKEKNEWADLDIGNVSCSCGKCLS